MNVEFNQRFYKDLDRLRDKKLRTRVADVIDECKNAGSLHEIRNLKKLEGYKDYFRIRIGEYRIGMVFAGGVLKFLRIANKKDIYKGFP